MKIKKFSAKDMADAMRQIRNELGPDAIILHQKKNAQGGFWKTFRRPGVEVLAAIDTDLPPARSPARPKIAPREKLYDSGDRQALRELQRTVMEVRQAITRLESMSELPSQVAHFGEHLSRIYAHLLEQDVTRELAYDLVHQVFKELSPQALQNVVSVTNHVRNHLQSRVRTVGPLRVAPGETRTIFLVGPTGVGKTTTLAKMAANFTLYEQRKVALLTTDTYRIAAIPQLRTYGEIMGLNLEVAYSPSELRELVLRHQDKDIVLVDTPGRSQHNRPMLEEMADFIREVPSRSLYLAISAASKYRDMLDVAEYFGVIPIDGIVVTKLDETITFGPILNLAADVGRPFTYFTTGQDVPSDIEVADAGHLADRLLSGQAVAAPESSERP